jgi:hypothetical protein
MKRRRSTAGSRQHAEELLGQAAWALDHASAKIRTGVAPAGMAGLIAAAFADVRRVLVELGDDALPDGFRETLLYPPDPKSP